MHNLHTTLALSACIAAGALIATPRLALAQVVPETKTRPQIITPIASAATKSGSDQFAPHRFWDRENDLLFAGVAASRALDYSSTLNMRRRGRQEILLTNDVVDNHPAFAVIEVAATGVSVGASYLFHHYGHHKLERWTSIVHATLATSGAIRNYSLKTAHPTPLP